MRVLSEGLPFCGVLTYTLAAIPVTVQHAEEASVLVLSETEYERWRGGMAEGLQGGSSGCLIVAGGVVGCVGEL